VNRGTEAETAYYRIFDLQGRPLFTGMQMPAKMPAAHVMVVECSKNGSVNRRYVKNR
jgi:hypothetical protein